MKKEKYIEDLQEIKEIMNRSTKFISLSGLSGVSTGVTALAGAIIAYWTIFKDHDYLVYHAVEIEGQGIYQLLLIVAGTLILSIGNAIYFTRRKTKNQQQQVWDIQTKRLLLSLFIPLFTGGILCLMVLQKGFIGFLPPLSLIFYGLALVNGSKYTLSEIRSLGLIQILLGLIAFQFIEYGLFIWTLGFGVIQVIYGLIIQLKYKS